MISGPSDTTWLLNIEYCCPAWSVKTAPSGRLNSAGTSVLRASSMCWAPTSGDMDASGDGLTADAAGVGDDVAGAGLATPIAAPRWAETSPNASATTATQATPTPAERTAR